MPDTSPPPGRRHPEKAGRPDQPSPKKPDWIRVRIPAARAEDAGGPPGQGAPGQGASGVGSPGRPATGYGATKAILRGHKLHTVCEEAACPNIGECWARRHATYMILGAICTRACAFCNVATGKPGAVDATEPERLARSVADLGLKHVVITSVDRDDLADGGAEQFVRCIAGIRATSPGTTIEVLTPDFRGKRGAGERVFAAAPDVFNHNLETVPRLYPTIRPGARYYVSLRLLDDAKAANPGLFTKSGIMVGLGEERAEILAVMDDLRSAHVDFLTIGQYLQPTPKHAAVARFVPPEEFAELKEIALARGFLMVAASPLTRSSYHADRDFALLQESRRAALAGAG